MTNTNTSEYVCSDCGSDLLQDGFISAVCGACGNFNAVTRQDYKNYVDAVEARVGSEKDGGVRLVESDGIEGAVLTDGDAWVHCKQPTDTQANL